MEGSETGIVELSSESQDLHHSARTPEDETLKDHSQQTEKNGDEKKKEEALCSFVTAVNDKFNDDLDIPSEIGGLYLPKRRPVEVTDSGIIRLPRQVSMTGCNICEAGDHEVIESMCTRVEELDLMSNNIQSWEEVFKILECTPELTFLNLSQNEMPPWLPDLSGRSLPNLTRLVLNNTKVSWKVLHQLLEIFPKIEELHLSVNDYASFDIPSSVPAYPSLQQLFFVGNSISDWKEINRIGAFFPNLELLMLSETNLYRLNDADQIPSSFPCLKILGLNRTCLESWEEVEKLRKFPKLTDARLRFIPFLENQAKEVQRHHTIALLPNVTLLNQTPVSDNEREDAERAYIRMYMDRNIRPSRYDELEKIHGKLNHLWPLSLKPKTSVQVIVKVEEVDDDDKTRKRRQGEEMELSVKMTMNDLRKLLSNVVKHPANKLHLYHIDKEGGNWMERMLYPTRKLLGYHIGDGDEIIAVKMP